jgi:transcriptional regulator with XRE-family HTH domain
MANRLGITLTTIHRYESGEREISLSLALLYAKEVGFELNLLVKV